MSCSPIPVYFCLLSRWHFVSQHVHRAVKPPTILSQSIHTETPWIRDFFPAKSSIVHPIHKFINNNSYCGKKKNPMFLLTHKQSNKAWCVPPWENCLSTTGRGGGGIRHRLTTSHLWNTSKREMASIRDIQKNACLSTSSGGKSLAHTSTDNCLSLREPSVFVCGWLSKFTSTIGQGVPTRPKARNTLGWIN